MSICLVQWDSHSVSSGCRLYIRYEPGVLFYQMISIILTVNVVL